MDKVIRDIRRRVELNEPLRTIDIGQIVKGDMNADRFVLELLENGKPLDLGEYSVSGMFLNAIGVDVPIVGEVEGNVLTATLGRGCYDVRGMAGGFLRIANGDATVIRTVIRFTTDVLSDGTGIVYDPDKVIGNIAELMAKIAAMEDATRDARLATQEVREALGSEGNAQVAAIRQAGAEQVEAAKTEGAAQMEAIEQKGAATLETIPADYTTLAYDVSSLKDTKADAIRDTSAKAVAHTLHAQGGPMSVTLYGKTVETGTGEKSTENPYTIRGVDKAEIQAGNKNLYGGLHMAKDFVKKIPAATIDASAKTVTYAAPNVSGIKLFDQFKPKTRYTLILTAPENTPSKFINLAVAYTDGKSTALSFEWVEGQKQRLVFYTADTKSVKSIVGYYSSGRTYLLYEECGIFEGVLTADDFEPYNANVIDMPLLPDGKSLMEGDTVENDVPSGFDRGIELNGNGGFAFSAQTGSTTNFIVIRPDGFQTNGAVMTNYLNRLDSYLLPSTGYYCATTYFGTNTIGIKIKGLDSEDAYNDYFATNPLKVYYRSTEYTPEKDIRVTKVTRKMDLVTFDGTEVWAEGTGSGYSFYYTNVKKAAVAQHRPVTSHTVPSNVVFVNGTQFRAYMAMFETLTDWTDFLKAQAAAGTPFTVLEPLADTEVYMTDLHDLRKPYGIMPVTVTGSGETAVEYPHQTKHYIDQKFDALAAALIG